MCFAAPNLLLRRPQMITSLPASTNLSAKANPMPVAPPVMRTLFPPISNLVSLPTFTRGHVITRVSRDPPRIPGSAKVDYHGARGGAEVTHCQLTGLFLKRLILSPFPRRVFRVGHFDGGSRESWGQWDLNPRFVGLTTSSGGPEGFEIHLL